MPEIVQLRRQKLDGGDLFPVASLRRPVAWFDREVFHFELAADDLDTYDAAVLRLSGGGDEAIRGFRERQSSLGFREAQSLIGLPDVDFVLRRYRGAPPDTVDILLERALAGSIGAWTTVRRIARGFGLPDDAVVWPPDDKPPVEAGTD